MNREKIIQKFGKDFVVNEATYHMGINHKVMEKIAQRFKGHKRLLDACSGAGFMSIAFAKYVPEVVAVDINDEHLDMVRQNAKIAGVESKVSLVFGDVSSDEILNTAGTIDAANMDPDWATGSDKHIHVTSLSEMVPPANLLFEKIHRKTNNIAIRLPKELDLNELKPLPPHEIQQVCMDGVLKFYMVYFGDLIEKVGVTRLEL